MKQKNIVWHEGYVSADDFERRNGHKGCVLWFTGLSSAGKSTIARGVEWRLFERGRHVFVMDGDNIRHGLSGDLGFSPGARDENIRRIGEVAKLFREAGIITLTAFISPYRAGRDAVRALLDPGAFMEIYVQADVETCTSRDPKGLYEKAISGEIPEFTGVSAPYEEPLNPELILDTRTLSVEESTQRVLDLLEKRGIIGRE